MYIPVCAISSYPYRSFECACGQESYVPYSTSEKVFYVKVVAPVCKYSSHYDSGVHVYDEGWIPQVSGAEIIYVHLAVIFALVFVVSRFRSRKH